MISQPQPNWRIDALPFILGAMPAPTNGDGLPDTLPFELSVDPATGRVIQVHDPVVEEALSAAYRTGDAMPSNFDEAGIGRAYADDFLRFVALSAPSIAGCRVLEIGSGNGYLLSRVAQLGATVLGVEPGAHGQMGAEKYGVPIIHGYFPSPEISGRFSLIFLSSVLEHLSDPVALLRSLSSYLTPDGKVILSVPDESPYIELGDVSTLFHEHWSYFDQTTLKHTIALAGYDLHACEKSGFGGSLYASLSPAPEASRRLDEQAVRGAIDHGRRYIANCQSNTGRIAGLCTDILASGRSLGIYVPGRFVNIQSIAALPAGRLRFFDDDPQARGRYYPGIPVAVEDRNDLKARPVDVMLVASHTFGRKLSETLAQEIPHMETIPISAALTDLI